MESPWRIGIDIGGTFTDAVLIDRSGKIEALKSPSRPDDPGAGIMTALTALAGKIGLTLHELLEGCGMVVHGATIATNTVLEGKGSKVGLLTTYGFRDTLEIRRGIRLNPWDHRPAFPKVLVPRRYRLPVRGRFGASGREVMPLSLEDMKAASEEFRRQGIESVAISFLHSYVNPKHELQAKEYLASEWGSDAVLCSHEISPYSGEYGRTSTTVLAAYVAKRVVPYLRTLEEQLRSHGLTGPLLLIQSNGGISSVEEIAKNPACLLLAGPAAQVGALGYIAKVAGTDNLISLEMGGTSCDLALMERGKIHYTDQIDIAGYPAMMPSVDIHTVSAGGGSIARLDAGGMITLGPDGAGSVPGPVCYGRGGVNPTNTDAQLVLGRLAPGPFAAGTLNLDADAARAALANEFEERSGLSPEEAAFGVVELMTQNLRHAVEHVSAERGFNPREFTLVAVGGAGALHASSVGRSLGCSTVYVPRLAGVFCAFGMLNSDVRLDAIKTLRRAFDDSALNEFEGIVGDLRQGLAERLAAYGKTDEGARFETQIDLNYQDQQSQLTIPWNGSSLEEIKRQYEEQYQALYGHTHENSPMVATAVRVSGSLSFPGPEIQLSATVAKIPAAIAHRKVFLDRACGFVEVPIYAGGDLTPGATLEGPAIINDATTTVVLNYGDRLGVDVANNLVISLEGIENRSAA
ncbi:hydantoinase/oxoprolinase family protein [Mesorhizobium sp. M0684]|uniref:hydantoinase/oxoprolinase family protein n=1 Tax=Mesorhizobium sp. M0684 TaxID=2956986 RepID=UPI003338DC97